MIIYQIEHCDEDGNVIADWAPNKKAAESHRAKIEKTHRDITKKRVEASGETFNGKTYTPIEVRVAKVNFPETKPEIIKFLNTYCRE